MFLTSLFLLLYTSTLHYTGSLTSNFTLSKQCDRVKVNSYPRNVPKYEVAESENTQVEIPKDYT